MADLQHKDLPDSQLHEPKGVSTASSGDIYVANGSGGGTWAQLDGVGSTGAPAGALPVADGTGGLDFLRYQGWAQYEDSRTTVGAPSQTLSSGVRTLWLNNGSALTIDKKPSDATLPLWNTSTNKHQPIAAFDIYHLRMSFIAENYAGSTPYLDIELDIGGSVGTIFSRGVALRKGGAAQSISLAFPVFSGSTYLANGGELYLTYNGTGTCDIYKSSVLIVRESKNFV